MCRACAEVTRDDVELGDEDLDAGAWGDPDLDLDAGEPGEANGTMDADHEEAEEGEEGEGGWEMEVCTAQAHSPSWPHSAPETSHQRPTLGR